MADITRDAIEAIAGLARRGEKPEVVELNDPCNDALTVPAVVLNGELRSVRELLMPWRTQPERRKGTATVDTLDSFIDLVNRQKDNDSAIFAGERLGVSGPALLAVLNYNIDTPEAGETVEMDGFARFGDHRIVYPFPMSDELMAWKDRHGEFISQGDLAEMIEGNVVDLAAPDADEIKLAKMFQTTIASPAELMLLSRDFRVKVEAIITEVRVLQSGEAEIGYEEQHKSGAPNSKGAFKVPGAFVINIPLFIGDEKTRVFARLRYRVSNAKVFWRYELYKLDEVLRQRISECANAAASKCQLPLYFGNPEL